MILGELTEVGPQLAHDAIQGPVGVLEIQIQHEILETELMILFEVVPHELAMMINACELVLKEIVFCNILYINIYNK